MRLTAAQGGQAARGESERSLTLLHVFLGASALILTVGAVVLSTALTNALTGQALTDRRDSLSTYVNAVLRPALVRGDTLQIGPHVSSLLLQELRSDSELVTVKVWRPDGVLAWTNRARSRIARIGQWGQSLFRKLLIEFCKILFVDQHFSADLDLLDTIGRKLC